MAEKHKRTKLCKPLFVIRSNGTGLYTTQNEKGNVIIRNRRHLILTDEKFTQKFSNGNIRAASTELPGGVAPLQTTNLSKPVTSLTTINHLKPITPNLTKTTRS